MIHSAYTRGLSSDGSGGDQWLGGISSSSGILSHGSPAKSIGSHSTFIAKTENARPRCVNSATARHTLPNENGLKGRHSGTGIPANGGALRFSEGRREFHRRDRVVLWPRGIEGRSTCLARLTAHSEKGPKLEGQCIGRRSGSARSDSYAPARRPTPTSVRLTSLFCAPVTSLLVRICVFSNRRRHAAPWQRVQVRPAKHPDLAARQRHIRLQR